ncbi:MAG: diaminopimelate decarboxylase [Chloroflexi bacterium]|nr:diaminopimelate decarboxylase [Chloroflexota bacterium]MCI0645206.1 diaminopimelate decarboxylase [Chloroflexota bacterium]MCI0725278.1 diaminopimelate decarboxylase [Chloroflexota bacterium]
MAEPVASAPAAPVPFHYQGGQLYCEAVPLAEVVAAVGTPVYVYSQAELLRRARAYLDAAAAATPRHLVCFAVKANGNLTLLRWLAQAGLGADVTSGGELFLAQHAGFPPEKILFSGVGKTRAEIETALAAGIHALHVESAMELAVIAKTAAALRCVAPISVRVNPDIAAATHPHISTGQHAHKFGVTAGQAIQMLREANAHPWLRPVGLAAHIGSQITELAPFAQAAQALCDLAGRMAEEGIAVEYLDVGGGLGIDYTNEGAPNPADWVGTVAAPVVQAGYGLVMEPGRSIVGPAGALLTQVIYTKQQAGKRFVVADAGMSDLIRPALYDAFHPIWPLRQAAGDQAAERYPADVVGPICETGDTLARERPLPAVQPGDLLAILQAGAYGFAMSSNYNGRPKPAEVLVTGSEYQLIRQRQSYEHLLDGCL